MPRINSSTDLQMRMQRANFFLGALAVHGLVGTLLWHGTMAPHRIAGMGTELPVMAASFIVDQGPAFSSLAAEPTPLPQSGLAGTAGALIAQSPRPAPGFDQLTGWTPDPLLLSEHDYAPADRLTRLPAPLGEIDLDMPSINALGISGTVAMTLWIDENGIVVHAIAPADTEQLRLFSDRVAERFKNARFMPGEIAGKPVKSLLHITVVSEHLLTAED